VVEVDGSDTTVRKTYTAGSTSLAVRTIVNGTENTLNWMLSDHLGSSSITTAADGTWNSEIRYSAFGETRYSSGITPTDYRYTGQLEQADVNLYYYNARYYDAALGRFIQADTIIPSAGDSKSYDRYAYVNNNPVRYTDPSGHIIPDEIDQPGGRGYNPKTVTSVYSPVVCGIGTNNSCVEGDPKSGGEAYDNKTPLSPEYDYLEGINYNPYYYGIDTIYDKNDVANSIFHEMERILDTDPQAKFLLVGHSAGADVVLRAVFLLLEKGTVEGKNYSDNIIGVVIMDSCLVQGDAETNFDQAMASEVIKSGIDISAMKNEKFTKGIRFPSELSYDDIPGYDTDHTGLAVNQDAANDFKKYVDGKRYGD
jgi:RHS repeat-associated protein